MQGSLCALPFLPSDPFPYDWLIRCDFTPVFLLSVSPYGSVCEACGHNLVQRVWEDLIDVSCIGSRQLVDKLAIFIYGSLSTNCMRP